MCAIFWTRNPVGTVNPVAGCGEAPGGTGAGVLEDRHPLVAGADVRVGVAPAAEGPGSREAAEVPAPAHAVTMMANVKHHGKAIFVIIRRPAQKCWLQIVV
jgi:hypothetical protein